jgi:hypothetical protein
LLIDAQDFVAVLAAIGRRADDCEAFAGEEGLDFGLGGHDFATEDTETTEKCDLLMRVLNLKFVFIKTHFSTS